MIRVLAILAIVLCSLPLRAEEYRVEKDLSYAPPSEGESKSTSLDVYVPSKGQDLPVVIWIHGGGWRIGDKWRVEEKPQAFTSRGMIFISINYRLDAGADYAIQEANVAQAVRWVHDHAQEYGGSPQKIFIMGHSAGAHLAALLATDERYLAAQKLQPNVLKGVILLDGAAYDIPRQIEQAPLPRMKKMYLDVFSEDVEKQRDASPLTHVAAGKNIPPFLILHVASRRDGRLQSEALGRKLREAGVPALVVAAENKTHLTINREFGAEGDEPTRRVFEFIEQLLMPPRQ